ncbi:hypothetical protein JCM4814A_14790 [Streptomyces phaeofaciens JCM 4814]|uniref:DUF7144 domain-containing protein n=1 Tax=Streptomyces phaeofaciens TaxID=68254 RepID=A0A918HKS6_9ACTN|nr:hypothetical protein [Streptomyces phaeofaciens]GGT75198.1 hypothetical protein GCM10010226_61700 [Streptomyces phaeofaciens]
MSGQSHSSQEPPIWDPSHQGTGSAPGGHPTGRGSLAAGGVTLAGVLMLVNGFMQVFQGISAIAHDDVYALVRGYVYEINLTAWGWILLGVGVAAAATGLGLLQGAYWARLSGVMLASLSAIVQFLFLPYSPVWSIILIAVDIFVIWALIAYRPDLP